MTQINNNHVFMPDIMKSNQQNLEKPLNANEQLSPAESASEKPAVQPEKEPINFSAEAAKKNDREQAPAAFAPGAVNAVGGLTAGGGEREKQVEKILEQGLEEIYLNLSPAKRLEFKTAGETAAKKINGLLQQAKIKAREIIKLIKKWLALIPGLNKYYLEQEAKIKADEIMKMKSE